MKRHKKARKKYPTSSAIISETRKPETGAGTRYLTSDIIEISKAGIIYLPREIMLEISKHLTDSEKLNFLSTCKSLACLRNKVIFNDLYNYENIVNSEVFNNFTRVRYISINEKTKFPSNLVEISVINSSDLRYIPPSNGIQSVIIRLVDRDDLGNLLRYIPNCRKIVIKKIKPKELSIPEGIQTLIIDCIRMTKGKTLTLPSSLKYLKIKDISLFNLDALPDSIETLCIGSHKRMIRSEEVPKLPSKLQVLHSRNIDLSSIPDTVHTLKLLNKFKKDMNLLLPESMKYLETDVYIKLPIYLEVLKLRPEYFRSKDKRILNIPSSLKRLEGYYNRYEMNLHDSLEHLNIHFCDSDPPEREKLPPRLKTLYAFMREYSFIHSFPETLEEIGLYYRRYYSLKEPQYTGRLPKFPQSLRKLELASIKMIPELPESIEYLSLDDIEYIPKLPKNLKHLVLSNIDPVPELPESLESLRIIGTLPTRFPKNLKSLTFRPVNSLHVPDSVSELSSLKFLLLLYGGCNDLEISPKFSFPDSIEELHIDVDSFPEYIRLPPRLKKLTIGKVKHGLSLPESITHLKIYYNCTEAIAFPPRLKYLEILSDLDTIAIKGGELPKTLEVLVYKVKDCKSIPSLPEGLRELHIRDYSISEPNMNVVYPKSLEILHLASNRNIPMTLPEYTEFLQKRNDIKYLEIISWRSEREILKYR
jgi:hypothetical protein